MATTLSPPHLLTELATPESLRAPERKKLDAQRGFVVAFLALAASLKVLMAWRAPIGPDEFQHLHATWCVWMGQTPYVDFFEHHPPFLYYLLQPVFWLFSPDFGLILAARGMLLLINLLIGYVTFLLARMSFGRRTAWWSLALLASDFLFFEHGFWVLTDVPAVLLTLISAVCLIKGYRSGQGGWFLASSGVLGCALLFTPKLIYLGIGVSVWFVLYVGSAGDRWQRTQRLRAAGIYLAGGLVPWGILIPLMGIEALPAFWQSNVVLNLAWKAHHSPLPHLRHMLVTSGPLWIAACVGAWWTVKCMGRRASRWLASGPVTLSFLSLALGAALLPVVWEEYFIELVPYGAILGAFALRRFAGWAMGLRNKTSVVTGRVWKSTETAAFGMLLAGTLGYNFYRATEMLGAGLLIAGLMIFVFLIGLLIARQRSDRHLPAGLTLLSLLLVLPLFEQAVHARDASNGEHREALAFVLAQSRPEDTVLDGYMGYGVFRPHAYWWWFLHDEVQLMLSPREKGEEIVEALKRNRPKVVLYDWWIERLEPVVHEYLRIHYQPSAYDQIWVRRDQPLQPEPTEHISGGSVPSLHRDDALGQQHPAELPLDSETATRP